MSFAQSFPSYQLSLLYNWQDTTLIPSWQYDNTYNEIWGVQINGVEIAIIGSTAGTHFFDVTDPLTASQVDFVAGAYTGSDVVHRDYHDYNGYLYIVCDEGNTSTLQIIDISNLPNSVSIVYDSNILFTKSHNIFIDTATAKLYVCAVKHTNPNNFSSAMEVYSLSNPLNPTLLYTYMDVGHVHDAYVRNDTAYLNCGGDGFRIVDFHYLDLPGGIAPTELASLTSYPDAGYNHSGWLNDDGTVYVMLDENHGYDIKLLDVSNFNNITVLSTFNSGVDTNSMAHNAIIKDGWLHTGDIGMLDANGYIKITDRSKDMFIVGGFNAYPAEIENILCDHPAISQAAVVGIEDERMGEVAKAFIILKPDQDLDADSLLQWSKDNMANYKVPREVEFVRELPTNAAGKIMKYLLKDES